MGIELGEAAQPVRCLCGGVLRGFEEGSVDGIRVERPDSSLCKCSLNRRDFQAITACLTVVQNEICFVDSNIQWSQLVHQRFPTH